MGGWGIGVEGKGRCINGEMRGGGRRYKRQTRETDLEYTAEYVCWDAENVRFWEHTGKVYDGEMGLAFFFFFLLRGV